MLKGIDCSHHNGLIDWQKVKQSGVAFAWAKATQGLNYVDSDLSHNVAGMRQASIFPGVYHFVDVRADGAGQADFCIQAARKAGFDFSQGLLALDLEEDPSDKAAADEVGRDHIRLLVEHFSQEVERQTGRLPVLYSYRYWLDTYLGDGFGGHALWLACLSQQVTLPVGWEHWTFLQARWDGTVPGVPSIKAVDMDCFHETIADLQKLLQKQS